MSLLSLKNLQSSAISALIVNEDSVKVTFQGKSGKEYTYNCENVVEFANNVRKIVNDPDKSLGSWVNRQIKDKVLILNNN
tara:strand:+ start:298 stop:537 length:240 start_codon:yes stop_codon:yes gene_type:complete